MKKTLHILFGLALLVVVDSPRLASAESALYFKNEFVVLAEKKFCPWSASNRCSKPLTPGLYLFTGTYLRSDHSQTRELRIMADDVRCPLIPRPGVYCSPNILVKTSYDPMMKDQWSHGFTNLNRTWSKNIFADEITVAVIDSGIDCFHEDINGACETLGYNAIQNKEGNTFDDNGHGTHVAGISCGIPDNKVGITGVADCKLMPIKALSASGGGSLFHVMRGIEYVADQKRKNPDKKIIVNLSLGTPAYSEALRAQIQKLLRLGIPVVAAAGNAARNNDIRPYWPASYRGVISVGALRPDGERASFSNWGKSVTSWAPGATILSTEPRNKYGYKNGTSMAAPYVSGVIALLLAKYPDLKPAEIKRKLSGVVDAYKLLGGRECQPYKSRRCIEKCFRTKSGFRLRRCIRNCRDKFNCVR